MLDLALFVAEHVHDALHKIGDGARELRVRLSDVVEERPASLYEEQGGEVGEGGATVRGGSKDENGRTGRKEESGVERGGRLEVGGGKREKGGGRRKQIDGEGGGWIGMEGGRPLNMQLNLLVGMQVASDGEMSPEPHLLGDGVG